MKKEQNEIIYSLGLFEGCDRGLIDRVILSSGVLRSFRSGETMEAEETPSVGILLSGRGVIYSSDKGRQTLLKFVSPGSAVGVASLFATEPPATRTVACGDGKSEMFFVGRNAFEELLEASPSFRVGLIKFLADRVSFLNSKIDTVTAGSAERRLAIFIKNSRADESGVIDPGMSMTALAHALDIGRASLYRAFDALQSDGIIIRNGDLIKVLSRELLDNF